jgi:hypothetical protein
MEVLKVNGVLFALGGILVIFGFGFVVAWHALDPKLHAKKEPPSADG